MSLLIYILIYLAFLAWYRGFGRALQAEEVDAYMRRLEQHPGKDDETLEVLRDFMQSDDGKPFVMVNLIELNSPKRESAKVLEEYSRPFLLQLLRRAGHPISLSRQVADAVDQWGVPPGADRWHSVALVRYRSRRDLIEMALWPRFQELHPFKKEAIKKTIAFPVAERFHLGNLQLVVALFLLLLWLL